MVSHESKKTAVLPEHNLGDLKFLLELYFFNSKICHLQAKVN